MADAQKVVELIFQGVDKTGAATQAALGNAKAFTSSLESATKPIAEFTLGALKLEGALLTAGAAVSLFAVKVAGDFDAAFREISTLIEAPVEDLDKFRVAIQEYAGSSTQPLSEITGAIYNAISAGVDYADSIEAIAQAEKLAVAGKAGLNESLIVIVSSLNAYGLGMDQAGRFSDALFTAVKDGQTTLPELAGALAQVTGVAATLEVPFETLLAAIATLTSAGTPTTQAVTQINAALSAILKPSAQAATEAARLGIEFDAQAIKAKGLDGVLQDVARATGGNEESMGKLFGSVEALKAVFPLTGAAADSFANSLENQANKAGATEAAFAKMAGTVEQENQKVKNSLQLLFVSIGDPLLESYGGVANAIAGIFKAIGVSVKDGGLGDLVGVINTIFADVQGTLDKIAANLPAALAKADFSGFEKGIQAVVNAIKSLFSEIDLTTVDGLAKAITLTGTAFLALQQYTAGVITALKPVFELLVSLGKTVAQIDPEMFKLAGSIGGIAVAINLVLPAVNLLLTAMIAMQGASGAAGAATAAGALTKALGPAGLVAAAGAAGYAIGTVLNEPINKFISTLTGSETTLGGWIYDLVNSGKDVEQFGVKVDGVKVSVEQLNKGVESGRYVWDFASSAWVTAAKSADALGAGLDGVAGAVSKVTSGPFVEYLDALGNVVKRQTESGVSLDEWNAKLLASGGVIGDATEGMDGLGEGAQYTAEQLKKMRDESGLGIPVYDALTGEFIRYERTIKSAGAATDEAGKSIAKTAEETNKAEEATRAWNLEMAKLGSAEKIALIASNTAIAVARIEGDAQKMVAAFDSVSNSITSTGETLSSLYGTLAGGGLNRSQELNLEIVLRNEDRRRQEAFELQKKLTEAQIKDVKARTDATNRGDAMIKIEGDGLQPHLEAFMWEILRAIQVRVNADGMDMLLGVPP